MLGTRTHGTRTCLGVCTRRLRTHGMREMFVVMCARHLHTHGMRKNVWSVYPAPRTHGMRKNICSCVPGTRTHGMRRKIFVDVYPAPSRTRTHGMRKKKMVLLSCVPGTFTHSHTRDEEKKWFCCHVCPAPSRTRTHGMRRKKIFFFYCVPGTRTCENNHCFVLCQPKGVRSVVCTCSLVRWSLLLVP